MIKDTVKTLMTEAPCGLRWFSLHFVGLSCCWQFVNACQFISVCAFKQARAVPQCVCVCVARCVLDKVAPGPPAFTPNKRRISCPGALHLPSFLLFTL